MNKRLLITVLICGLIVSAAAFQPVEAKKSVIIPNAALVIASKPAVEKPPVTVQHTAIIEKKDAAPVNENITKDAAPEKDAASENENIAAVDYFNLGISLRNEGMYVEAVEAFNRVLMITPGYGDAHYNIALAYFAFGNANAAFEEYQILRGIDAGMAEGLYNEITYHAMSDIGNKFIVQVGAFRNNAYAETMIDKLKGRYLHAYIEKTGRYNKVRICGIKSKEQGKRMILDISNEFNIDPYLVRLK
jgi:tetratricopeptide (TPR) repeat protein